MGRMMAQRLVPVAAKVIANVGAAAYAKATGRITLSKPCAHVMIGFAPAAPGGKMGGVRFIVNAVDQATYDPSRADKGFVQGTLTDDDAKLVTNFGVAGGGAKQQWHEWNPNICATLELPLFMGTLPKALIETIDILPTDLLDGSLATVLHVYVLAAE